MNELNENQPIQSDSKELKKERYIVNPIPLISLTLILLGIILFNSEYTLGLDYIGDSIISVIGFSVIVYASCNLIKHYYINKKINISSLTSLIFYVIIYSIFSHYTLNSYFIASMVIGINIIAIYKSYISKKKNYLIPIILFIVAAFIMKKKIDLGATGEDEGLGEMKYELFSLSLYYAFAGIGQIIISNILSRRKEKTNEKLNSPNKKLKMLIIPIIFFACALIKYYYPAVKCVMTLNKRYANTSYVLKNLTKDYDNIDISNDYTNVIETKNHSLENKNKIYVYGKMDLYDKRILDKEKNIYGYYANVDISNSRVEYLFTFKSSINFPCDARNGYLVDESSDDEYYIYVEGTIQESGKEEESYYYDEWVFINPDKIYVINREEIIDDIFNEIEVGTYISDENETITISKYSDNEIDFKLNLSDYNKTKVLKKTYTDYILPTKQIYIDDSKDMILSYEDSKIIINDTKKNTKTIFYKETLTELNSIDYETIDEEDYLNNY